MLFGVLFLGGEGFFTCKVHSNKTQKHHNNGEIYDYGEDALLDKYADGCACVTADDEGGCKAEEGESACKQGDHDAIAEDSLENIGKFFAEFFHNNSSFTDRRQGANP